MKKSKKQKFQDFDEYTQKMKQNSKNINSQFADLDNLTETKFQKYETPLQALQRLFPSISLELIENIYEESSRTFITTKMILEEMIEEESLEKSQSSSKTENSTKQPKENQNEDNSNYKEKENFCSKTELDLNIFTRFRYEEDDPFIEEKEEPKSVYGFNLENNKKYFLNLNNVNSIINSQKKNSSEYVSVFENLSNDITPKNNFNYSYNNSEFKNSENYLEEMIVDYYIDVILEFFPKLSRTEILEKICLFDFDIDKLILSLLDENENKEFIEDFAKLELTEISDDFKEEVLSNFYSGNFVDNTNSDLGLVEKTLFDHNLQSKIEKEIKLQNINNKLNVLYSEKDFPFLSDEVKEDVINSYRISNEYFLDQEIKDIKTKSIREDLQKLVKHFPFTDEFEIKWVYYQFMDFHETYKYFSKKRGKKNLFEKELEKKPLDMDGLRKIKEKKFENFHGSESDYNSYNLLKNKNSTNWNKNQISTKQNNINLNNSTKLTNTQQDNPISYMLFQIISEKPSKWRIDNTSHTINLKDYQSIRKKLLWQAQMAWRQGRHQDAKVIIAKARRYKQEIDGLLKNKKISLFVKTNQENYLVNCINNRENIIDLHGLSYDESKIIINKKIYDVEKKRSDGVYDPSQRFILNIITGVGHHSKNNQAVLLPKLSAYLKRMNYKIKLEVDRGIIKVYL